MSLLFSLLSDVLVESLVSKLTFDEDGRPRGRQCMSSNVQSVVEGFIDSHLHP